VHLQGLTNLRQLDLTYTQITDAGLVQLVGLTNLEVLELTRTQVTDAGLARLAGMNLKKLTIPTQAQTDVGLQHYLSAVEPSTRLDLDSWQITGTGLVHLTEFTNLKNLNLLRCPRVTDAGLVHLSRMIALRYLWLGTHPFMDSSQITEPGLVHLKALTNLESLFLSNTKITDAGLVELQEALPNCKIDQTK
jgi:Leucine-rich repeat (LRR) protein